MSSTLRDHIAHVGLISSIGFISALFGVSAPALAQHHRARVSKGLDTEIAAGGGGSYQAIVELPQSEVNRLAQTYGVQVTKRLAMGAVLSGSGAQLNAVANDANVAALNANDVVMGTDAITDEATGASLLWSTHGSSLNFDGLTGAGVGVAVIDSGIAQHPDLAKRVTYSLDFTGDESGVLDGYGHGTHVAGIIAGSGKGSQTSDGAQYAGMAPGAELVSLRVLGDDGTGYVADVISAIDWAITNKDRFHLRVINLSLGHAPTSDYSDDPLAQAVEQAVKAGLVVVASAGNYGKTDDGTPVIGGIVSPGDTPGALTVGALNTHGTVVRTDDTVATYSSRGPVGDPDDPSTWIIKPDLVAPGNAIVSTGAVGSYLWDNYPEYRVTGASGGSYLTLSGSSMATAVVSGAVAQLLQAKPSLSPAEVKFALQFTAQHLDGYGLIEQGAGSLNVPLAVALAESQGLNATPGAVEIGGAMTDAGKIAFSATAQWDSIHKQSDDVVWGNTVIPGNRITWDSTTIWGNTTTQGRPGTASANTIIWGNRNSVINANTIIWGNRGSSAINANTIIWGNRSLVWGATIIWGNRGGSDVGANTIIWGNRGGSDVSANTIIWGNRGGSDVSANTIIWGNRDVAGATAVVWGDTIIWGNRDVSGNTIIWGNRGGTSVDADTIIWGNRSVDANTIIWGNRNDVDANTIIWGNRGGSVGADTIIWGNH